MQVLPLVRDPRLAGSGTSLEKLDWLDFLPLEFDRLNRSHTDVFQHLEVGKILLRKVIQNECVSGP